MVAVADLTKSEREVLRRIASGATMKSIAADLEIEVRNVELLRARVMKKLDASTLAELIRIAVQAGMSLEFANMLATNAFGFTGSSIF